MKTAFRLQLFSLALLILMDITGLKAGTSVALISGTNNSFTITESSFSHIKFTNTIGILNTIEVNTTEGIFTQLRVTGYTKNHIPGDPELPVLYRLIEIPYGATPEVHILSSVVHEYKLSELGIQGKLYPLQPPQPKTDSQKNPFAYNKNNYESDLFISEKLVDLKIQGFLRSVRIATLQISPFEYNPVSNIIRVYENLEVEIDFTGADPGKTQAEKQRLYSPFFSNIVGVINNRETDHPQDQTKNTLVKYVIVSDPLFREALQPFVQWKTKKGFQVAEAYTDNPQVGKTTESIRSYLRQLYLNGSETDPVPTFVLFVGDVAQIPSWSCGTHVSDLYYCDYTNDGLPDVYYGRFSANTIEQLQPQIDKTLQYEQYLMPDPSYLNEVVMTAGADATHQLTWSNGQIKYGTKYYFNTDHNLLSHTYLQPEPAGSGYAEQIIENLSKGVSYANYTAHGNINGWSNPTFTIQDIGSLQNKDKYGLMVGNCCENSVFNKNSFAEELLRAKDKGALGFIGASDLSYWDEDFWWAVGSGTISPNPTFETTGAGAYDLTFHDHGEPYEDWHSTMGQMVFAGNLAVQEAGSDYAKYYWEVYCLMGDPSLMIYYSVPKTLPVDYQSVQTLNTNTIEIKTEPFAYIGISRNNMLHGGGLADAEGYAKIPVQPFTEPGFATLVVTKQNRQPYEGKIQIISPDGIYLAINNIETTEETGNKNHVIESGETISLSVQVKNSGKTTSKQAASIITTDDPYITFADSLVSWSEIKPGDSVMYSNAFRFTISPSVPDMHPFHFTVITKSDTNIFRNTFKIIISAPNLVAGQLIFNDSIGGNGNGRPDAGETIDLSLLVTNNGHALSKNISSLWILKYDFSDDYISDEQQSPGLKPDSSLLLTFHYYIKPNVPEGTKISVFIPVSDGNYQAIAKFYLVTGPQIEGFESGDLSKFNFQSNWKTPWTVTSDVKHLGNYAAVSGKIGDSDQSEMFIDCNVYSEKPISFYRKVSSEAGYDFLKFYIDGEEVGSWSGNQDWSKFSYPVKTGTHRFSWVYIKDEFTALGLDAAWIDDIEFPPCSMQAENNLSATLFSVPDTICQGDTSRLFAFASGGTENFTYEWTPSRTLSATGVFNPLASPLNTTEYDLIIRSGSDSIQRHINVVITSMPAAPVVTNFGYYLESSAQTGNQWFDSKGIISGATNQKYYPTNTETFYATATNISGCQSVPSNMVSFLYTGIFRVAENSIMAYPNPFTEEFSIKLNPDLTLPLRIDLTDVFGMDKYSMVYENPANPVLKINCSSWPPGIYFCRISGTFGVKMFKVIKSR